MAWMRVESGLRDHPKIIKLSRDTGQSLQTTVGQVITLWLWCLDHAADGDLSSFQPDDIEAVVGWATPPGHWYKSAVARRLLDETPDGAQVHDWAEYTSSWTEAQRKREYRHAKAPCPVPLPGQSKTLTKRLSTAPNRQTDRPTDRRTDRPMRRTGQTEPTDGTDGSIGSLWLALRERVGSVVGSDRGIAALLAWLANTKLIAASDADTITTIQRVNALLTEATTKDKPAQWLQWAVQRSWYDGGLAYRPTRRKTK